ncbi:unnamed protein product [Miscanthus lutarioriparius]|uniref:Uncharacterized protein n=1 Tax=Miscanthus lutarioriparius TaxID=422564 RepID=A0A811MYJ4_9POAL|nr:unnamed protein product [Miscanthus lutarioriparius]
MSLAGTSWSLVLKKLVRLSTKGCETRCICNSVCWFHRVNLHRQWERGLPLRSQATDASPPPHPAAEARSGAPPAPPPLIPPSAVALHCLRPQTSSAKGPLTLTTSHNSTKLPPLLPSPPPPTETHRHRHRRQRRRRRRDLPKQLAADRKNNKSSKSARRKVVQVSVRPGIEFQSLVLRDLCSDIVTPEPSSNSGAFWITPPFRSTRFSAVSISNMLSFFLCAPPHRVRASVAPGAEAA